MDINDVVLIDAAEQLRKLEDKTAKPYFAEHKPPDLRVGKNIDVVSAHLKAIPKVSNAACNTAAHRRSLRCHHEDAERACCLLGGVGIWDDLRSNLLLHLAPGFDVVGLLTMNSAQIQPCNDTGVSTYGQQGCKENAVPGKKDLRNISH